MRRNSQYVMRAFMAKESSYVLKNINKQLNNLLTTIILFHLFLKKRWKNSLINKQITKENTIDKNQQHKKRQHLQSLSLTNKHKQK